MLGFILTLVFAAIAIAGVFASRAYKEESGEPNIGKFVAWLFAGLTVVGLGFTTVTIVKATEVGVPVALGKVGAPLGSGVHLVTPWTRVESYPIRPVAVELAGDSTILARTSDAGQMRVEVATRWQVDPAKAADLYLQVRTGDDEFISESLVVKNLRQAVGVVYSRTPNLEAVNDRENVALQIQEQLQKQLDSYGVIVEDVNLRSVEPDEKTADTISQFARQQQATRIAEEGKKTAKIEAQRRSIEAKGLKRAARVFASVSPAQADVLCQQAWERMQAKALEAGNTLYTSPCGTGGATRLVK